jgi:segregation and condensation protein A
MTAAARRFPRRVPLEPRFAELLPEVLIGLGPAEFARLAALTLAPKVLPTVSTEHIHSPVISIREQTRIIAARLAELGRASFRQLTAGAAGSYEVVASFLALLELYREDAVSFEQVAPLGELYVTWTGSVDPDSADPDRADPSSVGPSSVGPSSVGPSSVGPNSAGTGSVSELTESDNEE